MTAFINVNQNILYNINNGDVNKIIVTAGTNICVCLENVSQYTQKVNIETDLFESAIAQPFCR